jgi:hypothetical protein
MFEVHQSSIKKWRRCKNEYYYAYIMKIEKRKKSTPLWRGHIAHAMLENRANGHDVWKPLNEMQAEYDGMFQEEKDLYGDVPGEVRSIMAGYFKYYAKDDLTPIAIGKGNHKRLAEHKFEIELIKGIILKGKIDEVDIDGQGFTWLTDHKTHKILPETGLKYSDIQSASYSWALEQLWGLKVHGMCWNYIRWKPPTIPELLKNGDMSRKNIDTTWEVYRTALKANGLKTSEYLDMRERLHSRGDNFYRREFMPLVGPIVENLIEEARVTSQEMQKKAGVDRTRTIDRHCTWCEYYNLCQAELRGLDTDFMLKHDYKEKVDDKTEDEELTD